MRTDTLIQPHELIEFLQNGGQLIDVREPVEYAEAHLAGSTLIPLGQLDTRYREIDARKPIVVMCQAGKRGTAAVEKLQARGIREVRNLEGGLLAWRSAGLPCVQGTKGPIPLMRQVQITVGFGVLLGSLLSMFLDARWVWLCAFLGGGLLFAGLSGFCGLALVLAKMPWNHTPDSARKNKTCCS